MVESFGTYPGCTSVSGEDVELMGRRRRLRTRYARRFGRLTAQREQKQRQKWRQRVARKVARRGVVPASDISMRLKNKVIAKVKTASREKLRKMLWM
jgi:Holliday junction resolvase RusA-like endonuclease